MLNVSKLSASYGAIQAVRSIDLEVKPGSLSVILGANGAGKSTTLRSIAGLHRPVSGSVTLGGREISKLPLHSVVRAGLAFVPEGRMVVAPLTVEENLELSRFSGRTDEQDLIDRIYDLFPRLKERRRQRAGLMSGGEQQMLAIGRALMTKPLVLILDEPSMGLAPAIVDLVFQAIVQLHKQGQSILLVEQNAAIALSVCDYGYVMKRGNIVIQGTPGELKQNPEVLDAYLS
ncbi:ABC transporter ATP-binding protein [Rhizobium sp. CFBP 8752]|uniref:ABC transporter ATP-binding protein n=1 Tax=Rhizobium sp. CFBP 8752 TaxID=2775301 RepID=UPI00177E21F2|nr:ABC transporter ATP-binding protein [Rhizobium sp. CFBP 8752]MBD8664223.1 ABC transporter ATP-binding protein [Rhizobium sp. CFBP 8752]